MTRIKTFLFLPLLFLGITSYAQQKDKEPRKKDTHTHEKSMEMKGFQVDEMIWMPGPKTLPAGAEIMILSGDPGEEGVFTMRIKLPAGYKVMPHWHGADENVTIIKGKIKMGMGDKFDESNMKSYSVGGYVHMPAKMHHYAMAAEETIIQLHGMGPFNITYINPKDDPSKMGTK